MTLRDIVMNSDANTFSLPVFISVNGEEALPVRATVVDDGRLILADDEGLPYDLALVLWRKDEKEQGRT